jgi:hypothetical protein
LRKMRGKRMPQLMERDCRPHTRHAAGFGQRAYVMVLLSRRAVHLREFEHVGRLAGDHLAEQMRSKCRILRPCA